MLITMINSFAFGYGYHDALGRGTVINTVGLQAAALGGTRVFGTDNPSALFLNPAELVDVGGISIYCSGASAAWNESVHDSTRVTERGDFGIGGSTCVIALPVSAGIVVSGGMARIVDNQYRGTHYLPNDPSQPEIDVVEILEASGGQWEALGGVSVLITDGFSAGISAGMRIRRCEFEYQYDRSHTPQIDSIVDWSERTDEFCYHSGFNYTSDAFESGITYTSETEFYYSRAAFGGRLKAAHLSNVWVGFEGELIDPLDRNYFNGRLSFEIPMEDKLKIMTAVGFIEGENMYRTGMIFSLGGSADFGNLILDFVLSTNSRCRSNTSFPEEYSDYVNDSWTAFGLGVNYTF